jgi:hypothetical protein
LSQQNKKGGYHHVWKLHNCAGEKSGGGGLIQSRLFVY